MGTVATRLPDETRAYLTEMAQAHNQSVSEFLRQIVEEYLDDQLDLALVDEYRDWQRDNPQAATYSLDEAREVWGL
ncbi:MAG: ribbon-helix-helix domain-containing protein [Coriobacteriales bacterium]|nr:ribbon-helix-helix domain-containing protein [Coriobacteriales bacterium]